MYRRKSLTGQKLNSNAKVQNPKSFLRTGEQAAAVPRYSQQLRYSKQLRYSQQLQSRIQSWCHRLNLYRSHSMHAGCDSFDDRCKNFVFSRSINFLKPLFDRIPTPIPESPNPASTPPLPNKHLLAIPHPVFQSRNNRIKLRLITLFMSHTLRIRINLRRNRQLRVSLRSTQSH